VKYLPLKKFTQKYSAMENLRVFKNQETFFGELRTDRRSSEVLLKGICYTTEITCFKREGVAVDGKLGI
jgi:hypothetical protein